MATLIANLKVMTQAIAPRPCEAAGAGGVVDYDWAVRCYNALPMRVNVKKATLAALSQILPWERLGGLDHAFAVEYGSGCLSVFTFVQPFPIYAWYTANGEGVFKIPKQLEYSADQMEFWESAGVDVTKLLGGRVERIDGLPPGEYLRQEASVLGVNSSQLMAWPKFEDGQWSLEMGLHAMRARVPSKGQVSYRIKVHGERVQVSIPYAVTIPFKSTSPSDFFTRYCSEQPKPVHPLPLQPLATVLSWSNEEPPKMGPRETYLWRGPCLQTSNLNDTGVLVVQKIQDEARWAGELEYAALTLEQAKVQKLIVDLRGSSEGTESQGQLLLETIHRLGFTWTNPSEGEKHVVVIADASCRGVCAQVMQQYATVVFNPLPRRLPRALNTKHHPSNIKYHVYSSDMVLDPYAVWEYVDGMNMKS
ncbi:hypothetical protein DSO57_1021154 [Entomophthora muscae]|uniref:Uncharacterized protein n=1 Tax=Entomophthora muscae TaxID=34485 RepID=A0ACC2TRX0_9FUNG|nr:hypothetical protein DSO57_1021154 [Entomophthora muscae]